MPLMKSKSKKAFEHNLGAEMSAGKDPKQALAIAYSVKRRAKRMNQGGMVDMDDLQPQEQHMSNDHLLSAEEGQESPFQLASEQMGDSDELAEHDQEVHSSMDNESGNSLLEQVMKKIRKKHGM